MVVALFAWGTAFYGLGFYLLRLHEIRGWSRAEISNIILLFYATAVILSFGVSKILARRGPRPVIATGALATGAALITMPHVGNLWLLVLVFLTLAVGWSAMNTNPISTTVVAWFPGGQRELSTALIGASFGGILLIPLLGWADLQFGFTAAVTALGLACIVCVGAVALLVIDTPPGWTPSASSSKRADRMSWGLLKGRDFWVVGGALGLGVAVQGGFLVHQLSILGTTVSAERAAQVVGVATFAALVGRLGPIVIGDRVAPALVGASYLAIQALAMIGLAALPQTGTQLTLMSMVYGLGVGVLLTMPSLLTRTTYPDLPYTSAYPVVNLAFQVPLAIGAPTLAYLHDALGGYQPSMWVLAAADLVATVLLLQNHRTTS